MPSFDQLFGKLAIDRGFVSAEDVEKALERQPARESPAFLGEILIDMGRMTEVQVAEVLSAQGLEEEFREGAIPFGRIALRNSLLSALDLKKGLDRQKEEEKRGSTRRIGEILVDQKSLSPQEADAVLQRQQLLRRKGRRPDLTKRHRPSLQLSLGISLLACLAASALGWLGAARPLNDWFYDALHGRRPSRPPHPDIAIVYVGDRDIARFRDVLGKWPWRSRRPHQVALELLHAKGAKLIGLDLLLTEPSFDAEHSDQGLAEAMAAADGVVNACVFYTRRARPAADTDPGEAGVKALEKSGGYFGVVPRDTSIPEGTGVELPIAPLLEAEQFVGHINADPDPDGVIRRAPLFMRYGDKLYPSLALQLAIQRFGIDAGQVSVEPGRAVSLAVPGRGVIRIPVDDRGRMRINFRRHVADFTGFQYTDLEAAGPEAFRGKTVVVGISATGNADVKNTPMDRECPGFLIHAAALENILEGDFVRSVEPDERPWGGVELVLQIGVLAITLLLGTALVRWPWWLGIGTGAALVAIPFLLSGVLFVKQSLWLPPAAPAGAFLLAGLLNSGYRSLAEAREKGRVRRVYERYLSPQVLETILRDPALLKLGGTRKEMTFFFSDIRGFTVFSESIEPEDLTVALNEYFTAMTDVIHRHGATLDKFVGDCIVAFFNDPLPQPDHAVRAVKMALEMRKAMIQLQKAWVLSGKKAFGIGMGIHTGYATVGNFGSDYFTNYTVVGGAVNLAARIEQECRANQILVSSRTYHLVKDHVVAKEAGLMQFKGISEKVEVWEVTRLKGEAGRDQG